MKKILLSLAVAASISLGLSAQTKDEGHKGGDRSKALKQLNLTAEQQQKMKVLSEDFKTKSDVLRNEQKNLRKNFQADVKAILTPDQQAKWQQMVDKRRNGENRGERNYGNRNGGGKQMNLDDATKAKLTDLRTNFEKDKNTIEKSGASAEVQQEKIQSLKEKFRNDRREIIKTASPKQGEKSPV